MLVRAAVLWAARDRCPRRKEGSSERLHSCRYASRAGGCGVGGPTCRVQPLSFFCSRAGAEWTMDEDGVGWSGCESRRADKLAGPGRQGPCGFCIAAAAAAARAGPVPCVRHSAGSMAGLAVVTQCGAPSLGHGEAPAGGGWLCGWARNLDSLPAGHCRRPSRWYGGRGRVAAGGAYECPDQGPSFTHNETRASIMPSPRTMPPAASASFVIGTHTCMPPGGALAIVEDQDCSRLPILRRDNISIGIVCWGRPRARIWMCVEGSVGAPRQSRTQIGPRWLWPCHLLGGRFVRVGGDGEQRAASPLARPDLI